MTTTIAPTCNWGGVGPSTRTRPLPPNPDAISELVCQFTPKDVALLQPLQLDTTFSADLRRDFTILMMSIEPHYRSQANEDFVRRLLGFIPPFMLGHDWDYHQNLAHGNQLVAEGYAQPMLALYMLTLRSGYWQKQFWKHGFDHLIESYDLPRLAGDPTNLPWEGRGQFAWETFAQREDMLSSVLNIEIGPRKNVGIQLVNALETMVYVASRAHHAFECYIEECRRYLE